MASTIYELFYKVKHKSLQQLKKLTFNAKNNFFYLIGNNRIYLYRCLSLKMHVLILSVTIRGLFAK